MSAAKLIFITGPSGSGKSATAKEVAASWPTTCALLDFDNIRTFIQSGYAEPANGWNDETEKQWELAKHVVTAMAQAYTSSGVSVVLEVFATPHDYPQWQDLFGDMAYKTFALLPEVSVVVGRNNQREGTARLKESDIAQNYDWSVGWKDIDGVTVIDNGNQSVVNVANHIIKATDD